MKILDLHGLTHNKARESVIRFVERHWMSKKEAKIITGNSIKMQKVVCVVLDEYKLDYQFSVLGHGYIMTWFE